MIVHLQTIAQAVMKWAFVHDVLYDFSESEGRANLYVTPVNTMTKDGFVFATNIATYINKSKIPHTVMISSMIMQLSLRYFSCVNQSSVSRFGIAPFWTIPDFF